MIAEIIKALGAAKTEEEEMAVAEKYNLTVRELTDEELDQVAGGGVCRPNCTHIRNKCWCE